MGYTQTSGATRNFLSLPDHLEKIAEIYPDRPAVIASDAVLTYAELHREADQLAGVLSKILAAANGGRERRVAVLFEHGAASLVAALGSLKCGAAVVLLDPAWPQQRLEWVLSNCAPAALLTSAELRPGLEFVASSLLILTPASWADALPWRRDFSIAPDATAFILATSGSTGQPKAVVELHQNIVHEALRLQACLALSPDDRQSVLRANCAGAISDTYSALLAGACVLPFDPLGESYDSFQRWLDELRPTIWRSAPSLFRLLFTEIQIAQLRLVFLCGETAYGTDLELFRSATNASCKLINCYGTSETATASFAIYAHDCAPVEGPLAIGEPAVDVALSLLDESGATISGVGTGQLVVRSPYLCSGYLGGQAQDDARFGVDAAGRRYYLTGDLGQRLGDGTLLCLGRVGSENASAPAGPRRRQVGRDPLIGSSGSLSWNGKAMQVEPPTRSLPGLVDKICQIWSAALDLPVVGSQQNFFELGGTSLLAMVCCIELERQLQLDIAPAVLMQTPTPTALARRIVDADWNATNSALVPMRTGGEKQALFLLHGWGGDVFCWAELSRTLSIDRPIVGVQALFSADAKPVHRSTEVMAAYYTNRIRALQPDGPYHLCGISSGGRLAWAVAELLRAARAEVGLLALIETGHSDDLSWWGYAHHKLVSELRHLARRSLQALGLRPELDAPDSFAAIIDCYCLGQLDCDVEVIAGEAARVAMLRSVSASRTTGTVNVRRVPGRHETILRRPHVAALAFALAMMLQNRR